MHSSIDAIFKICALLYIHIVQYSSENVLLLCKWYIYINYNIHNPNILRPTLKINLISTGI